MPTGSPNAGYLTFNTGQILTAAQVQYNLQNQTIMYFATTTARDTALPVGVRQEGMACYIAADQSVNIFNGTAWVSFTGDITALTAGTGITITNASGPVPTIAVSSGLALTSPEEVITISASAATGAIDIDVVTSAVNIRTTNATADWTINVRGDVSTTLDSLMAIGSQISVVFESPIGATAYEPTAFTVDGSAPASIKWLGGSTPTGNINSTDVYVYTIRKSAAATFTVIASQSKFA
jgi:hypothetical protein